MRYVQKNELCEVPIGEGALLVTYWRMSFVRYVLEKGLCGVHIGE